MSKIVAISCLGSSFVLSRAWRNLWRLPIYPDPVSGFVLGKKSTDLFIPARVPLLFDGIHSMCFCYRCRSQFEGRPPSMVTGRIFTRHCGELVRQAMVPMVFCSVSFGQSFALGSTRPLAICMGAGGDQSRALLLFSRTLS